MKSQSLRVSEVFSLRLCDFETLRLFKWSAGVSPAGPPASRRLSMVPARDVGATAAATAAFR